MPTPTPTPTPPPTPDPSTQRHQLERLQLDLLQRLTQHQLDANGFFARRLQAAGLARPPRSIAEFVALLPPLTKEDLRKDQLEHPPFGSVPTPPLDRYVRLHQTSSSTGQPLRWLDTQPDWQAMVEAWVLVLRASGLTRADRVFVPASFGPFIGFWLGFEASTRLGCLTIPGGGMPTSTRLRAIFTNRVTALICTPTYALRLAEAALAEGLNTADSALRALIVAGEPGGSIPAVRDRLHALWPTAQVHDHHGMTETGPATYQTPGRPGHLTLIESHLFAEFIDPVTLQPIDPDRPPDLPVELVLTTLRRPDAPVLRYRTGDLVRPGPILPGVDGLPLRTLVGGVLARADDMLVVRGVNVYPAAIESLLRAIPGLAEYRVLVSTHKGMTELTLEVEPAHQQPHPTPSEPATSSTAPSPPAHAIDHPLGRTVERTLRDALGLRVHVRLLPQGALPRSEFKSARWVRTQPHDAVPPINTPHPTPHTRVPS